MTNKEAERPMTDSELGSEVPTTPHKLTAILCPTACALFLVCLFVISFLATKVAYEQYDALCGRRYDVAKLYIFPISNFSMKIQTDNNKT